MKASNIRKAGWCRKPELADTAMGHTTESERVRKSSASSKTSDAAATDTFAVTSSNFCHVTLPTVLPGKAGAMSYFCNHPPARDRMKHDKWNSRIYLREANAFVRETRTRLVHLWDL